jgi:hypothetical protein
MSVDPPEINGRLRGMLLLPNNYTLFLRGSFFTAEDHRSAVKVGYNLLANDPTIVADRGSFVIIYRAQ